MSDSNPGLDPQPPLHGFRGNEESREAAHWPRGLSIALSRESGARGTTIARRVARKLGWQVVDQDLVEYLVQNENAFHELPADALEWVEQTLNQLLARKKLVAESTGIKMARNILCFAAQGEVVLIGRGAGYLLPRAFTLHVRVVAPEDDRINYISQSLRLTREEAIAEVRKREQRKIDFFTTYLGARPDDPYVCDLILNSSRLGEEMCTELIVQAARAKSQGLELGSTAVHPEMR